MIVPLKNAKTYGVLHTENYFSFLGFSKKVNSEEIQKVDIYLDDELIDTIIADKHLQKIEDIYELEGFGFEYILPNEYIGKKNVISFKNHETKENLQNSPYVLIDETHPRFNEMAFLNSLETAINEKKIKEHYPNSIGFLATEENLNDSDFMSYIKDFIKTFPQINFNGFCFDKEKNESTLYNIILISSITDIVNNVSILITNYRKNKYDRIINERPYHRLAAIGFGGSIFSARKIRDINVDSLNNLFKENLDLFGLNSKDLDKYHNHILLSSFIITRNLNPDLLNTLIEEQTFKEWQFKVLNIGLINTDFLKNMNFLRENFQNLLKNINR